MSQTETMEAALLQHYGDADVIEFSSTFPIKPPGPNEVLVSVLASTVNPIDCRVRQGYGHRVFAKKRGFEFPYIPGSELSGTVVKVGSKVNGLVAGDAVIAAVGPGHQGTNAAYCTLPYSLCVDKPPSLSFADAATVPYSALTTATAFTKAGLDQRTTTGKRVLVHGGSGGIGTIAIPWLKAWGATVATTVSAVNIDYARQLGADHVVDYGQQDFSRELKGYDVVIDTVGGDYETRSLSVLARGGSYVTLVTPMLANTDTHGMLPGLLRSMTELLRKKRLFKKQGCRYEWVLFKPDRDALQQVAMLCEQKLINPKVRATYPLKSLRQAHRDQETNSAPGRIVISHNQPQK